MRANNFDQIYTSILWNLYTNPDHRITDCIPTDKERTCGFREITGFQFKLTDIEQNTLTHNLARGFKIEYAQDFFNYVLTGDSEGVLKNPKAIPYLTEFAGRNTQYGPRIREQLDGMLEELKADKNSRRGTILILEKEDQKVLPGKRGGDSLIEYPCTNSLTFSIRGDKLHLVSNMRSQSACMVLPYEVYNWTNLMKVVCALLVETYPNLTCGTLTHQVASLHYMRSEDGLVKNILAEYGLLV